MSSLFSLAFLSSRLARPIHRHPDQNTTTDFHNASETSSFQAAPTPDSLDATPTRRDLLCPAIAWLISVRLEPIFVLCTTFWFVLSLKSLSLHRHGDHNAQETRNQQTVGQLSVSKPNALELPHAPASHIQYLVRFAVFVFQAAHTWTEARFVPRFRSQPDLCAWLHFSSGDQCRP